MKADEVATIADAREFLRSQEAEHAKLVNNQNLIPNAIRNYLTTQALQHQTDGRISFLSIEKVGVNHIDLTLHWFDAEATHSQVAGR